MRERQKQLSLEEGSLKKVLGWTRPLISLLLALSHMTTFSCKGGCYASSIAQLKFDFYGKRRMNSGAPLADF